ncbi:MAG: HlyD family efflux transporter periplasmic adaptor subunit [Bacteroidota bacterium]
MSEQANISRPEDIQINEQEEVRQILGAPPGWILYWGITFIAMAMVILTVIAQIVKYPDTIPCRILITTENPPIRVVSRVDGKIEELLVSDRQIVDKGELLAVMESTAKRADVETLLDFLAQQPNDIADWEEDGLPQFLQLGPIQNAYASFVKQFATYQYEKSTTILSKRKRSLRRQIRELKAMNRSLEGQAKTLADVERLRYKDWQRQKKLGGAGVSSAVEIEKSQAVYLDAKRQKEAISTSVIDNRVRIAELDMTIAEIKKQLADKLENFLFDLGESRQSLQSQLLNWQQNYLVYAPIAGMASMSKVWSAQQFVKTTDEIMTIVPQEKAGKFIAKGQLPGLRSGKVAIGTRVNIRLDGFPYQEFGVVPSSISDIAPVSEGGSYLIYLDISDSLTTTYGKQVDFRQEMQGTGLVITQDRSILERLLDRVISALKN